MAVNYSKIDDAYRKKLAAIDQGVAADGAAYDAQRADITEQAEDRLQQIYLKKERAHAGQKQANKAAGITGGAAEAGDIALQTGYMTDRTNAMLDREKQLNEVDIAENQRKAQAQVERAQVGVEQATGRLSFDQQEANQKRSEDWEFVKSGIITQEIAARLGHPIERLRKVYEHYKEN
jgi:hypothetical protein